jgi:L-2-hydroxyglutarate oxidase LhgO
MEKIDILVIGAGVVGLAIARECAMKNRQVIVAEREKFAGSITSSRNSGVIHAGIYYPKNSLKAALCVEGRRMLYAYARERNIAHNKCGKMIVACDEDDLSKLQNIQSKAAGNGVDDLSILSADAVHDLEPSLSCLGALMSPSTGIVDVHNLIEELTVDIEDRDGLIAYDNVIEHIEILPDGFKVELSEGESIMARSVVNAAGLGAQKIARKIIGFDQATIPSQYFAKGHYFSISGAAPFSHLIYPVPVKGGLGTHFTMNMAGDSIFGPDVEWLEADGPFNYDVDESRAPVFKNAIARYWPDILDKELMPAYSGIRPKVVGPGEADGDFMISDHSVHGVPNLVNLYGIESPGLTAALAIGKRVADGLASS